MEEELPVYFYYHRFGLRIIHWWAAIMGCDISEMESGVVGAGRESFIKALRSIGTTPPEDLTSLMFATKVREFATKRCRLSYSVKSIANEMDRVVRWFTTGGTFYDNDANVFSVAGKRLRAADNVSLQHMRGNLNPKTRKQFTKEEKRIIERIQPHNLLHNSAADRDKIVGHSLPSGPSWWSHAAGW